MILWFVPKRFWHSQGRPALVGHEHYSYLERGQSMKPWWNLNSSLAKWLGKQLIDWSHKAHSHPGEYTHEEWTSLLYLHGCTLLRYGKSRWKEDFANFYSLDKKPDNTDAKWWELVLTADGNWVMESDLAEIEAKHSLRWVTDHFYTLWD